MKTKFALPDHLHVFEGDLYDNRKPFKSEPLRKRYSWSYTHIHNLAELKATLRSGCFAWPGGYPLFLITKDGAALCFDCAVKEFRQIVWDYQHKASTGWKVVACDVNYEDHDLYCDHCSKQIESAYGEN